MGYVNRQNRGRGGALDASSPRVSRAMASIPPRRDGDAGVGVDARATFSGRDVSNDFGGVGDGGGASRGVPRRRRGVSVAYSKRSLRNEFTSASARAALAARASARSLDDADDGAGGVRDADDPPPVGADDADSDDDRWERYSGISSVSGYSDMLSHASGYTGLSGVSGMYVPSSRGDAPPHHPDDDDDDGFHVPSRDRPLHPYARPEVLGSNPTADDPTRTKHRTHDAHDVLSRRRRPAFAARDTDASSGSRTPGSGSESGSGDDATRDPLGRPVRLSSRDRGASMRRTSSKALLAADPHAHLETVVDAACTGDVAAVAAVYERHRRERLAERSADARDDSPYEHLGVSADALLSRDILDEVVDGRAALHVAAERGDSATLTYLLDRGSDPNVVGALGLTPTHVAAYCGRVDALRLLFSRGAATDPLDGDGSTPLHWAASAGKLDAARLILSRDDVDIAVVNRKGLRAKDAAESSAMRAAFAAAEANAAPHALARDGKLPIARRLVESEGLDPNSRDASGETMAHHAAREGHAAFVRALVEDYGARPDLACHARGATPFHLAAERGRVDVLETLRNLAGWERILQTRANARTTKKYFFRRRGRENGAGTNAETARVVSTAGRDADARVVSGVLSSSPSPSPSSFSSFASPSSSSSSSSLFYSASGSTPAHLAAAAGHASALRYLADAMFADLHARDDEGATPLHVASARGEVDVVEFLLSRGASADAADHQGCTPLHLAAEQNRARVARRLVADGGANVSARNAQGNMAVHLAAAMGHLDMVVGLLPESVGDVSGTDHAAAAAFRRRRGRRPGEATRGKGANVGGARGWTCLHFAAHGCYLDLVETLLKTPGVDPSPRDAAGATPTHLAAEGGSTATIEATLRAAGDDAAVATTDAGLTPLHVAAAAGHLAATRLLLEKTKEAEKATTTRSDRFDEGSSSASFASKGFSVDFRANNGYTALHFASSRGHDRVVRALLSEGARVAVEGDDGRTPVHLAAAAGADATLRALLSRTSSYAGSFVNARDGGGATAAALAAGSNRPAAFEILLAHGADPFVPDDDGNTCLHAAALAGARDVFLSALREGIRDGRTMRVLRDVNRRGERPIHLAARGGSVRMVRCLIDRGADVAAEDDDGNNALAVACEADKPRVATLLLAHAYERGVEPVDVDGVTPARLRWMSLRRSVPDIAAAARGGVIDPAAPDGASEQALVTLALTRLGLGAERNIDAVFDDGASDEEFAEMVRDAFKRFDEDGSGSLDVDEILAAFQTLPLETVSEAEVRATFARFDADDSGALDLDEFSELMRELRRENRDKRAGGGVRTDDDSEDAAVAAFARRAAAKRTSLMEVLDKAREAYKRRQRDRYVNAVSSAGGRAALHVAARRGSVDMCRLLLRHGADPNLHDARDGDCALHHAAREGHLETVELLLSRGARQRAKNKTWYTPLHLAARNGDVRVAKALLADAVAKGNAAEIVDRARRSGTTPLHSAVERGHADAARLLLAHGADWNARTIRDESVAHFAAKCGVPEILRVVLERREAALANLAAERRRDADADSDAESEPELEDDPLTLRDHTESFPLHWAAEKGNLEAVRLLVEAGTPINVGGMWRGATAAHLAARRGHVDVLAYLHSVGADMNAQDAWNYATPLILAAEGGHANAVSFLLDRRARLDARDKFGATAEDNARTEETRRKIFAARAVRTVVLRVHGPTLTDAFLGWRDLVLDARAWRARDAKGTWRAVFALFGDDPVARYYWLWRQWETRGRRRRRAVGDDAIVADVEALASNPGMAGLSYARVAALVADSEIRVERRGAEVFREGDFGDGVYVLTEGRVDLFMTHENDEGIAAEAKVATLKRGATFGEVALRFDCRRTSTARVASREATFRVVRREPFRAALASQRDDMARETRDAWIDAEVSHRKRKRRRRKRTGRVDEKTTDANANGASVRRSDVASSYFPTVTSPEALSNARGLPRALRYWEREYLAALLTVARFEPGDELPTPEPEDARTRRFDAEDGYWGFVLDGEITVTSRAAERGAATTDAKTKTKTEVLGVGGSYFSIAERARKGAEVTHRGAVSCFVSPAATAPAVVAVLQGMDAKEMPRSLQELLFRRAPPPRWDPPPRDMPRSTAEPNVGADSDSEESDDECDGEGGANRRGSDRDGSDSDDDSDGSDSRGALDAHGASSEFVRELVEAFRYVDTDNGGDIDEKELKFAARALGFEPDPRELKAMLDAIDEDGGGTVDLGEFVGKVTERVAEVTAEDALDAAFDCFDVDRKGFIVLEDVARAAKRVGDNVTSEELDELMNLGAADVNDDGEIDREEFALIMNARETSPDERRAAFRREIARQARAAEEAEVVAQMLGEYGERGGAGSAGASELRRTLRGIFASIAGPGKDPDADEIEVRDLIAALRRDGAEDGSLAETLHLPSRIRRDDGSADMFQKIFREIDADGNGAVDLEEFFAYFRRLKKEKATEIVGRAIARFEEAEASDEEDDDA